MTILATVLGTPFFYDATFVPGKDHAVDGVLFTAAVYLTYRYLSAADQPAPWIPYVLGAVFGFSYTVRYFSGAAAVALVLLLLWWRRPRHAIQIAATSAWSASRCSPCPAQSAHRSSRVGTTTLRTSSSSRP